MWIMSYALLLIRSASDIFSIPNQFLLFLFAIKAKSYVEIISFLPENFYMYCISNGYMVSCAVSFST